MRSGVRVQDGPHWADKDIVAWSVMRWSGSAVNTTRDTTTPPHTPSVHNIQPSERCEPCLANNLRTSPPPSGHPFSQLRRSLGLVDVSTCDRACHLHVNPYRNPYCIHQSRYVEAPFQNLWSARIFYSKRLHDTLAGTTMLLSFPVPVTLQPPLRKAHFPINQYACGTHCLRQSGGMWRHAGPLKVQAARERGTEKDIALMEQQLDGC